MRRGRGNGHTLIVLEDQCLVPYEYPRVKAHSDKSLIRNQGPLLSVLRIQECISESSPTSILVPHSSTLSSYSALSKLLPFVVTVYDPL